MARVGSAWKFHGCNFPTKRSHARKKREMHSLRQSSGALGTDPVGAWRAILVQMVLQKMFYLMPKISEGRYSDT